MPSIRTSVEAKRGCGYRKPGGLYLVSGKLSAPCGKLPLPLHVCPTCSQGIKPTRSMAWINAKTLFGAVECGLGPARSTRYLNQASAADLDFVMRQATRGCERCPAGGLAPERGGLLWVGGAYYKTAEEFSLEATRMGISRRLAQVPKGLEVGKTVVYLAHRQVEFPCEAHVFDRQGLGAVCTRCQGSDRTMQPAIFAAFVPRAIEYVVKDGDADEKLERLEKRGIELVKVVVEAEQLPLDMTPVERANVPGATL